MRILYLFITCVLFTISGTAQEVDKCGTWRWNIKTLTDNSGINWKSLKPSSAKIEDLIDEQPPKSLSTTSHADAILPRYPSEQKLVRFKAYVMEIKKEKDHDLHFVLQSTESDSEMVGEIPDPDCPNVADIPAIQEILTRARDNGLKVKQALAKSENAILVEVTGVPFWDATHGQTGGAPNGREIHPITEIKIIDNNKSLLESSAEIPADSGLNKPNNPKHSNTSMMENTSSPLNTLIIILIGAILGAVGQGIRVIVGVKKVNDVANSANSAANESLDYKQMAFSLLVAFGVGGVAGVIAAVTAENIQFTKSTIIAFITVGYAGTDFIEGFIKKNPQIGKRENG